MGSCQSHMGLAGARAALTAWHSTPNMYYRDHRPRHFHAKYGSYEIVVSIADGVVEGRFPRCALQHVLEWYTPHRAALLENWELAEQRKPLKPLPPLE